MSVIKINNEFSGSYELIQHLCIVFLSILIHGFLYLWALVGSSQEFDFALYFFVCVFAPLMSAGFVFFVKNNRYLNYKLFIIGCMTLVSFTSIMFICGAIVNFLALTNLDKFFNYQRIFIGIVCASQLFLLFLRYSPPAQKKLMLFYKKVRYPIYFKPLNVIILVITTLMISGQLNGKVPFAGHMFSVFFELSPRPSGLVIIISFLVACSILYFSFGRKPQCRLSGAVPQKSYDAKLLTITLFIIPLLYLDVRFDSDLLHFLTIAAPTNQLMHANGVPLIDTYSQYGLGPLLMNWLVFELLGSNLHLTNLLAQAHSIGLYCIIIVCIWRTSDFCKNSLIIGAASISIVIAGWYYGNYSINSVPSSMGLRYLPWGLVVLAISLLNRQRDHSVFLKFSLFISTVWSIDALLGSYILVSLWIILESLAFGNFKYFFKRLFKTISVPFTLSLVFICLLTIILAEKLPDLKPVFEFISVYNFNSGFWAIKASNVFWGWLLMAAIYGCSLSYCWYLAIYYRKNYRSSGGADQKRIDIVGVLRSYAPLSGLVALMSAYFVGRSVDFTLIIAFLPVLALVVPGFLKFSVIAQSRNEIILRNLVVGLFLLSLTFSFSVLIRDGGPYKPIFSEILRGRIYEIPANFKLRPMLDKNANPNFEEHSGLAQITITAIENFAPHKKRLTLLLGMHPKTPWSVHTDMVYLLSNRANTFPISYVLSDQLLQSRLQSITNHEPNLKIGDIVIVRRNKDKLQDLEKTIWHKLLLLYEFEQLTYENKLVDVYKVTSAQ